MASLIPHPQAEPISALDCSSTLNAAWFWHDDVLNSEQCNQHEFNVWVWTKEKEPFSQINISLLADFGCFFLPIFRFSAKRKNGRFSIIPARTRSVVNVDPNNFRWPLSNIKGPKTANLPKICIFGHFGLNIGLSDPFSAMFNQKKQYEWGAKVDFCWCGYQNFCSLPK